MNERMKGRRKKKETRKETSRKKGRESRLLSLLPLDVVVVTKLPGSNHVADEEANAENNANGTHHHVSNSEEGVLSSHPR